MAKQLGGDWQTLVFSKRPYLVIRKDCVGW